MKSNFLEYYRANLEHLRELSAEFAVQYPKIASKLNVSALDVQDPFVERLLEGTAFIAARVEKKFDDGYPQFLQSLLQRLCPSLETPIPAATVVTVNTSNSPDQFSTVSRTTSFEVSVVGTENKVRFSPVWEEQLISGGITDTSYVLSLANVLPSRFLSEHQMKSALCVDFALAVNDISQDGLSDDLTVYLNMPDSDASYICEALEQGLLSVYLKNGDNCVKARGVVPQIKAFSQDSSIFRQALKVMPGLSTLQMFFNYPFLYHFVVLKGLGRAIREFGQSSFRVVLAFDRQLNLTRSVKEDSILINAIGLVNLFMRRSDRTPIDGKHEVLLDVSRTRPLDYEVYSVDSVEVYSSGNEQQLIAVPFYEAGHSLENEDDAVFFNLRRTERLNGLYKKRSTYTKTEVFASFAGRNYHSDDELISEFVANCWSTNADLPLFIRPGSEFVTRDGRLRANAIISVTRPGAPLLMRGNMEGFAGLSYVMMNISTLLCQDAEVGKTVLRQLIAAFYRGDPNGRNLMCHALADFRTEKEVFRFVQHGSVFYEQGYKLHIVVDEKELTGIGSYVFGSVMLHLISDYSPINLLLRVDLSGLERGFIAKWDQNNS